MGNTEANNGNSRQVEVMHEKFKMVEVMENMEDMILTIPYEQKSDITEWEKLLKNVRDCDPQFLLMPKKYMITEQGLCGSSGVIKIVFDCFTYSFEDEIKNHSEKKKHFEETEIWYLLFAIISSVKEMDRLSMKVGDMRPHNIFVNENGQVKLAGVYSWPREVENYLKTSYDKIITYLSPQELHQCRVGEKPKRSHIVNESFSVGMTLLHTCLLKSMQELYNLKKYEFNAQKLQYELRELRKLMYWNEERGKKEKYSDELLNIIGGLLELDEGKRLSTLEIFNQLEPHAEEILNLRQFQIPHFASLTPTKQQHQSILVSSLQHHGSSPQYSSIPKKEFNEPQSIAFDSNYPFGMLGSKDKLSSQQQPTSQPSYFIPQRRTPEKKTQSKQKIRVSLSNEKRQSIFAKTQQIPQYPRESVSRQKFNSNLQAKFTVPLSENQQNNKGLQIQTPSTYQYTGEFKTYDGQQQFQPYKQTGSGSNYLQGNQRIYEAPPLNYTTSNYVNYQQRFQIPSSQTGGYSPIMQPSNLGYTQPQVIPQFTYKPNVSANQVTNYPSGGNYSFPKNIQFIKSDYTSLQPSIRGTELSHRPSIIGSNQQNATYVTNVYQTSTVKPVLPGQMSFNPGSQYINEPKPQQIDSSDLLKRIQQQLNKSKQMYSNGTTI